MTSQINTRDILAMFSPLNYRNWATAKSENAGFVTGSFTVKERISTFVNVFDETTVSHVLDSRASYAANTVTVTGGTNSWIRDSWKDHNSAAGGSPRRTGDMFAIEIDTTNMTSGALYIGSFAMDVM